MSSEEDRWDGLQDKELFSCPLESANENVLYIDKINYIIFKHKKIVKKKQPQKMRKYPICVNYQFLSVIFFLFHGFYCSGKYDVVFII